MRYEIKFQLSSQLAICYTKYMLAKQLFCLHNCLDTGNWYISKVCSAFSLLLSQVMYLAIFLHSQWHFVNSLGSSQMHACMYACTIYTHPHTHDDFKKHCKKRVLCWPMAGAQLQGCNMLLYLYVVTYNASQHMQPPTWSFIHTIKKHPLVSTRPLHSSETNIVTGFYTENGEESQSTRIINIIVGVS